MSTNTNNAPERINFASGWYIEYPKRFQKGNPRDGEYWLYDNQNIGKMIVGFDEDSTLKFAAAMQPAVSPTAEALRKALQDLVDDLSRRAKMGDENAQGVVACGNGVWVRAQQALAAVRNEQTAVSVPQVSESDEPLAGMNSFHEIHKQRQPAAVSADAERMRDALQEIKRMAGKKHYSKHLLGLVADSALSPETVCGGE